MLTSWTSAAPSLHKQHHNSTQSSGPRLCFSLQGAVHSVYEGTWHCCGWAWRVQVDQTKPCRRSAVWRARCAYKAKQKQSKGFLTYQNCEMQKMSSSEKQSGLSVRLPNVSGCCAVARVARAAPAAREFLTKPRDTLNIFDSRKYMHTYHTPTLCIYMHEHTQSSSLRSLCFCAFALVAVLLCLPCGFGLAARRPNVTRAWKAEGFGTPPELSELFELSQL